MTARRSAYAEALRRAGGMAATAAADDGATAVAAEPRPRSPFEEPWEESVVDLLPPPADGMPGVAPPPQARRPWADGAPPSGASADGAVPVGVRRPWADRPTLDDLPPHRSYAPVDNGERPQAGPRPDPVDPRSAARPNAPSRANGPTARAGTEEVPMTHVGPPPPAPGTPPLDTPRPLAPVYLPPPQVDDHGAAPVGTAASPAGNEPIVQAATASDAVRAEPVRVESQPTAPAEHQAESTPVVVEIGQIEVRVVTDAPSGPPRERRPRPRTGPTLDEYLGSAAGRGTS
ncbi:hypothetical protein ACH4VM_29070 [Streptomyces sp. NPDC020792]|uniref:hypothetical protein n=1 Tax=Streptomyces sp. NPDC020792 TaxID=3365089 RepID=UPI0037B6B5FF